MQQDEQIEENEVESVNPAQNTESEYEKQERKIERSLSQFMFLMFVPNSNTGFVNVYIDEGEVQTSFSINDFVEKIATICGRTEANRIRVACNNLGIPFYYDREQKVLKELHEKPVEERITARNIRKFGMEDYMSTRPSRYTDDNIFSGLRSQYDSLIKGIMNTKEKKNGTPHR